MRHIITERDGGNPRNMHRVEDIVENAFCTIFRLVLNESPNAQMFEGFEFIRYEWNYQVNG